MVAQSIIVLNQVHVSFKKRNILQDVNLSFENGKTHLIIGNNGVGKSLLLKIICGFLRPTSGEVIIDEKKIDWKRHEFPDNIGFLIEHPGFLPTYSAMQNMDYFVSLSKRRIMDDIPLLLKRVGLDPQDNTPLGKYSMGMKQRFGIAQALLGKPKILVLDEPMSNVDSDGLNTVIELLSFCKEEGCTTVITSHQTEKLLPICDRIFEISCKQVKEREVIQSTEQGPYRL